VPVKATHHKYCGKDCKNAAHSNFMRGLLNSNWRGGRELGHTKEFRKITSRAIRSLDGACVNCGSVDKLVCHHLDENKRNDEFENLVTLCKTCHIVFHKSTKSSITEAMTTEWRTYTTSRSKVTTTSSQPESLSITA
jgi:5-methylcytosine-specific restriction endonuclease McrA